MKFIKSIFGLFTSGSASVEKTIDIIAEKVEDVDKKAELIAQVLQAQIAADTKTTVPIMDAIHKLGRQLMMIVLAYWYYESWQAGNPIPIDDFMLIAGGPALYTLVKGKGNG